MKGKKIPEAIITFINTHPVLVVFIAGKLLLSLWPFEYGIFRDELYFLAMSSQPDFGYLDVPPLAPFLQFLTRHIIGTSYVALHLLPAVFSCIVLFLTYRIVEKLGGGRFAVILSLLCVACAPQFIVNDSMYTYDYLDKFFWVLSLYLFLSFVKSEDKKYLIYFGIAFGLGLLTKITILFLGFALVVSLLLTKKRKLFTLPSLWISAGIAVALFLPYILWQISKGLPFLEYYINYASGKTYPISPVDFLVNHLITQNPATILIWIPGILYYIINKQGRQYNFFAFAFLILCVLIVLIKAKYYIVSPFFVLLFAGGAVLIEKFIKAKQLSWLKVASLGLVAAVALMFLPLVRPVLPVNLFAKYNSFLGLSDSVKYEQHDQVALPQHYADRFGWEELTEKVAAVYHTLPPADQAECTIITFNYGRAGAVEYYGKKYNLPVPVCGHLQYYLWGTRGYTGETAIVIGAPYNSVAGLYNEVKEMDRTHHKYVMAYENNVPIYLCKGIKKPLEEILELIKVFN